MPQFESNIEFNIQNQIDIWIMNIKSEPSNTEADYEKLRNHFLDLINQFKERGLDDEEAFWVASKRLGTATDRVEEYKEINNPVIQIRTSALILAGVLVYFLFYHFIEFSSKLLYVLSIYGGVNAYKANNWVSNYLYSSNIIVIILIASIYFLDKKVISFIENVNIKPNHTILLLITTFFFAVLNISASPIIKNLVNKDINVLNPLYLSFKYFDYTFPLVMCIGFILIHFKYYKTAKFLY